jgi:peptidoglycan/xylan/chitin deacetylase (PgdA/CDA1 family)
VEDTTTEPISEEPETTPPEETTAEPIETLPPEPETLAPEDVVLLLPPLTGMTRAEALEVIESALPGTSLPEDQFPIRFVYGSYPLPAGTVYDAEFVGEKTEEAYFVEALGGITLKVSRGIPWVNVSVPKGDKTAYISFDDGPNIKYTEQILDVLKEYDIKATFFMVGKYMEKYPEIARRVREEGHSVGCHSCDHNYTYLYTSKENTLADLAKWEKSAEKVFGEVPSERLYRFPGGSLTAGTLRGTLKEAIGYEGYRGYDWNALNNDSQSHLRPKDMTAEEYMKDSFLSTVAYSFRMKTSPHIVLVHETYQQTVDMLPWMIEYLREQGCTFATPDTLDASWYH